MNSLASEEMVRSLGGVFIRDVGSREIVDSMSQVTVGTGSATTVGLALISFTELEPELSSNQMFVHGVNCSGSDIVVSFFHVDSVIIVYSLPSLLPW